MAKLKEAFQFLELQLDENKYVAGDQLTLADLFLLVSASFAEALEFDWSKYENVAEWNQRVRAELPYYDEVNKEANVMIRAYIKAKLDEI